MNCAALLQRSAPTRLFQQEYVLIQPITTRNVDYSDCFSVNQVLLFNMDKVLGLAPRIIIVSAIAVAFMKIFGNQGILITLAIIAALLTALYFYQNKLLYMPGRTCPIQIFRELLTLPKKTLKAIVILQSIRLRRQTSKQPQLIMYVFEDG